MSFNMLGAFIMRPHNKRKAMERLKISSPNSIVEEQFVSIGGQDQWVSIRGEDRNNPVILILHGGPASTYGVASVLLRDWEKHFTVVQWDQRGAGRTLRKNGKEKSLPLSFERLAEDGIELTEYLIRHLKQQKIILIGSSVGSMIGVIMAQKRPDLFFAYVGSDQASPGSDALAYQMTLDLLRQSGNKKGVAIVEKIGPDPHKWTMKNFDTISQWMINANTKVPNMIYDILLPCMMAAPGYKLRELGDILTGMKFSLEQLYDQLINFDPRTVGTSFKIPFFIFQGDSDTIAPVAAAKKYFAEVAAPKKEMVLIKNAGHLGLFARPEQFLQELLRHVRPLAVK